MSAYQRSSLLGSGREMLNLPPWTRVSLHTSRFIACSGFTQGPPVLLQPGQLATATSIPSESAIDTACLNSSCHSGLI